jgi:NAD(P)-dependent dehydrogenase (short-subunit alcohol dehydrogenase family)
MQKVLIITGASRGIGRATAQLFVEQGFQVYNLSRSPSDVAGVEQIDVDLGSPNWSESAKLPLLRAIAGATQTVLVHNAGANIKDSLNHFDAADFRRVMEINVVAPALLSSLLLPEMRPGSSIIYVGSTLSEIAVPNSCAYVTSKHALLGLMRSTCQDLAGSGIHTACVCPGFTDTEMLREHVGNNAEILQSLAKGVAYGRLIEPQEIARAILFCAENPVLNGSVLHANLGQVQA